MPKVNPPYVCAVYSDEILKAYQRRGNVMERVPCSVCGLDIVIGTIGADKIRKGIRRVYCQHCVPAGDRYLENQLEELRRIIRSLLNG